jgi:hypothetical protein
MDDTKSEKVISNASPAPSVAVEKAAPIMKDVGADLYLEVQQYSVEELESERKTVLRKIDWVIMPLV